MISSTTRTLFISLLIVLFLLITKPLYAQTTCDACGLCEGSPPPADYNRCITCIYENITPPPSQLKTGVSWTVLGCVPTTPEGVTQSGITVVSSVAGGIIFIVLLYGSFLLLTSRGDPQRVTRGKQLVVSSLLGLVVMLFAVFILQFVAVDILHLPGFGEG